MAAQPETPVYDASVYQWEITDPVQGGVGGVANNPVLSLANRTAYLKQRLDSLATGVLIPPGVAPLNNANFTGSTTAPNVADGDDSTLIANTHFVQRRDHGYMVVTTTGGTTVLTQPIWGVGMILIQGTLTSNAIIVFPSTATGKWLVWNQTTGAFSVSLTIVGQNLATAVRPVQGNGALIWSDGANIRRQDNQLTGTGEVFSADLAPTGVTSSGYNKANIVVGTDGRITSATNGSVSNAEVLAALGFTPVQQGGGAFQLANKVFMGWDGIHLRGQVDVTDMGRFAMVNDFALQTAGTNTFRMDFASKSTSTGNMFFQMFGGGAVTTGSGSPETTFVTMPWAFPNAFVGAIGSYLGNTPPLNSPLAVQPASLTQVGLTVTSASPATLGCVILAFGF